MDTINYTERIKSASPIQLVLITYELIIANLIDAKNAEEEHVYEMHIKKSQNFLMQLMTSLNMTYSISNNLLNIYLYVNKMLSDAYFNKDEFLIDTSLELLNSLNESFEYVGRTEEIELKNFPSFQISNGKFEEIEFDIFSESDYKA